MEKYLSETNQESQSYARIRKAIGYLGAAIPFLCLSLSLGGLCKGIILPSISHYYYSIVGDGFVGILFALGLVLILYKSVFKIEKLRKWENRLSNLAGLLAMVVAFIPTFPLTDQTCSFVKLTESEHQHIYGLLGHLHLPAAGIMLIIFGILSYNYFPRNWQTGMADSENKKIYRICAWVIFISIFILLVYFLFEKNLSFLGNFPIVFVFEFTSILAFAISWLEKGRAVMAFVEMVKKMKEK